MFVERWGLLGDNSLSCGELGSLLNRYALSGVSPRLLFPRESRRPRASPGIKRLNGPSDGKQESSLLSRWYVSVPHIWKRWAWKLRDSRGQKSLGETP
ncbi:hypothetical protein GCM10011389_24970 [Pontibacillus salipaludis]|uniref:Uncharacterized protein n=1 Tax=Pontibacillus salipaludis TaxID=1697394 RepID=A0ABQ1Q6D8_9BACI|nr:hypothetical protein GCM10011389_24970 [Pontibacillus salipaludis]